MEGRPDEPETGASALDAVAPAPKSAPEPPESQPDWPLADPLPPVPHTPALAIPPTPPDGGWAAEQTPESREITPLDLIEPDAPWLPEPVFSVDLATLPKIPRLRWNPPELPAWNRRKCPLCYHPHAAELNSILHIASADFISERYDVPTAQIHLHRKHMSTFFAAAIAAAEETSKDAIIERLLETITAIDLVLPEAESVSERMAIYGKRMEALDRIIKLGGYGKEAPTIHNQNLVVVNNEQALEIAQAVASAMGAPTALRLVRDRNKPAVAPELPVPSGTVSIDITPEKWDEDSRRLSASPEAGSPPASRAVDAPASGLSPAPAHPTHAFPAQALAWDGDPDGGGPEEF